MSALDARLRGVLANPPHRARLPRGLAMAFSTPDRNGRCWLTLSRRPETRIEFGSTVRAVVHPSDKEIEIVKRSLRSIIGEAAYRTLSAGRPYRSNGHGCVRLYWYAVQAEKML